MTAPRFAAFLVNYRSAVDTARIAAEFLAQSDTGGIALWAVDNSEPPDDLSALSPDVHVLRPGRNMGYFGAVAAAFDAHREAFGMPDWTVISNTDVTIGDSGFLALLAALHDPDPPAVIAPSVISEQFGVDQNPHLRARPSKWRMRAYGWVFRAYALNVAYQGLALAAARIKSRFSRLAANPATDGLSAIYAPHGAFLVIHRSYFERGGDLRHGAFLFGEEIYMAETARGLGLRVVHDPRLRVLHREHSTMGSFANRTIARHRGEAAAYLADRYFS